jgi:hypothetical protein
MTGSMSNYQLLISKLDQFIRKYYINKLIRGLLYSVGFILLSFLVINLLEYYFYLSTTLRKVMFYGFIGASALSLVNWVLLPLLNYFHLGKVISHEQAAQIVGSHFTNVKDKLLNILQLKEQSKGAADASLIEASVNQKIEEIKPVPFSNAIDLRNNRQYAKYALVPILLLLAILIGAPNLLPSSAARLINNNQTYEPPAPFQFTLVNADMEVVQFNDFDVVVTVQGDVLPSEAFIVVNNFPYKLKKNSATEFGYKFSKVQKDLSFYFEANGVKSKEYTLKVIPKPAIVSFFADVQYPAYTGQKSEQLRNSGDMVVPAGTTVTWSFEAQNTDEITVKFDGAAPIAAKNNQNGQFSLTKRMFKDTPYSVYLSNARIKNADSISYNISVVPDLFPVISANERRDSLDKKYLYFFGDVADDYGLRRLEFKYKVGPKEQNFSSDAGYFTKLVDLGGTDKKAASFTYMWDANLLGLKAGDRLTYFFEVWDNDGVNGSKSSRSQMMTFEIPTMEEMEAQADTKNKEIKSDLEKMKKNAQELKDEFKKVQEKILQKKEPSWEDKERIENLLQKHSEMQEDIKEMQEEFKQNMEDQKEFKEFSEDLQKKQEQLQKLMDELLTDEMKEMLEKLKELMEKLGKEETLDQLKDFEMNSEQMEKEMDRMLELFKQLEFEQKMNETIDKLNELAKEEEKLSEETQKQPEGNNLDKQQEKQDELNKKFDDLKKDMKDLQKMSDELDNKMDLEKETEKQQQDISEEMQQSMQEMQQQKSQSASKKQKNAAKKMQEMAQNMQQMQMQQQQEQMEEDMQAIRQLLENLVKLSMDQEDVMQDMQRIDVNTPLYTSLVRDQFKLKDDARLIEDSLMALSRRVFQLESFITKELTEINRNMGDALDQLADRKPAPAATNQQYIMTSVNNLALMLDEAMQQMQQQMAQQMQGNQMCQKPGSNPKGMKGMSQLQKQLNDRITKMQQGMKEGKSDAKQMSREAAELAAKQAAIRKAMEQMQEQRGKDGKKLGEGIGDLPKQMEQTETDLVNKRLTAEMLKRQQEILNRMLRAEDAEREQDWDEKRLAETAREKNRQIPPEVEEYLKKKQSEIDLYKTVPPTLKPYYKTLVERYFKAISF